MKTSKSSDLPQYKRRLAMIRHIQFPMLKEEGLEEAQVFGARDGLEIYVLYEGHRLKIGRYDYESAISFGEQNSTIIDKDLLVTVRQKLRNLKEKANETHSG